MSRSINRDDLEKFHELDVYAKSKTILLFGEINGESAEKFIKNFHVLEQTSEARITVLLNTDGGDQDHGMAIYDTISNAGVMVTIRVVGCAYSMGSVILQAADHREITKFSSVMFHRGHITQAGSPRKEAKSQWEFDEKYSDVLDDIIYNRVKGSAAWSGTLSRKQFNDMNERATYLRGLEAVEWGLADEVV